MFKGTVFRNKACLVVDSKIIKYIKYLPFKVQKDSHKSNAKHSLVFVYEVALMDF